MDTANECPKCGFTSDLNFSDCPKCGVIINKFLEREKKQKEFENKGDVSERHPSEEVTVSIMKQIVVFAIVAICAWWGWTHVFNRSEADVMIKRNSKYIAEVKISDGEKVDLKEHLVPGQYTVFLFYADW